MPFAGITYHVRPGFDRQIAATFSPENFTRVDSPFLHDEAGEEIGCLVCTGLFLRHDTMVRVIQHHGGTMDDIRRHMSGQVGVHEAERQLAPYLAQQRDTSTPAGFAAHFDRSRLTVLDQDPGADEPAAALLALHYPIRPTPVAELAALHAAGRPRQPADSPVLAAVLLATPDAVVRVFQHEAGAAAEVVEHLCTGPLAALDAWLAPLRRAGDPALPDPRADLDRHRMTCVSHLSAAATG